MPASPMVAIPAVSNDSVSTDRRRSETALPSSVRCGISEISHSVRQAARGTEDVVAHMPGVTKAVDETSQSATQMLQVSRDLGRQAEQLRHTVENFLRQVAAADTLKRVA